MQLKKSQNNDKLLEKTNVFQLSDGIKNIHRSKLHLQHTHWRKKVLQLLLFKVCESFRFGQIRKT